MANKRSMLQVAGTTYRIQAETDRFLVVRIRDDRNLGAFQHQPALRILESEGDPAQLLAVARAALQTGRLPWNCAMRTRAAGVQQRDDAKRDDATSLRPRSVMRTWASLLIVLWPNA